MRLFLSWRDGVRITELADAIKEAATAGLEEEEAGEQWQEWVDAHHESHGRSLFARRVTAP